MASPAARSSATSAASAASVAFAIPATSATPATSAASAATSAASVASATSAASAAIAVSFAALILAVSAFAASQAHASQVGAHPADIPDKLEVAAPAPLDALFALVHSVVFDQPDADDPRWSALYKALRERDNAHFEEPDSYHPDMQERLREWAIAYRAGLPEVVQSERHLSAADLREDAAGRHYIFSPLEYQPAALRDYADALGALSIPLEQTALWRSGGVTVLIIATNRLDQFELPVAKSDLNHVDLHTTALFRTGPVETLVDTQGRHILLLPVQPVGLTVHDNGETVAQRSYDDIPVIDGKTVPVKGFQLKAPGSAERLHAAGYDERGRSPAALAWRKIFWPSFGAAASTPYWRHRAPLDDGFGCAGRSGRGRHRWRR